MISILHPSRGRPDLAYAAAEMFISKAGCEVEYILSIDFDDPAKAKYFSHLHKGLSRYITCVYDNRSAVDAINHAAAEAKGDILVVMSDDFECPDDWGKKIMDQMAGQTDWIMKVKDGIQDWVITLPIMHREYYNRFCYIYNPEYLHGFCDTEMTCVAELTDRKVDSDMFFRHRHYSAPGDYKLEKDAIYERSDAHFEQGRSVFIARKRRNFYLANTPGKMTENVYTDMR